MFEEAIIYLLMIALAAPTVILALVRGDRMAGETTICLGMLAIGIAGIVRLAIRRWRWLQLQRSRQRFS